VKQSEVKALKAFLASVDCDVSDKTEIQKTVNIIRARWESYLPLGGDADKEKKIFYIEYPKHRQFMFYSFRAIRESTGSWHFENASEFYDLNKSSMKRHGGNIIGKTQSYPVKLESFSSGYSKHTEIMTELGEVLKEVKGVKKTPSWKMDHQSLNKQRAVAKEQQLTKLLGKR
jgi:hypothetical protein